MYGHVRTMAEAEIKGIKAAGGEADLFQYAPHLHAISSPLENQGIQD